MIQCAGCGSTSAAGLAACAKCGAALPPGGASSALMDDAREEQAKRELRDRDRVRRIRKGHALTGFITFFVINFLLGLPYSLSPVNLFLNLLTSAIFGLPIGYVISLYRGGIVRGALISAGAFIVVRLILGGVDIFRGAPAGAVIFGAFLWGIAGVLPGAIIGLHVESDE